VTHPEQEATAAIEEWRRERFAEVKPPWQTFRLTEVGVRTMSQFRDRVRHRDNENQS